MLARFAILLIHIVVLSACSAPPEGTYRIPEHGDSLRFAARIVDDSTYWNRVDYYGSLRVKEWAGPDSNLVSIPGPLLIEIKEALIEAVGNELAVLNESLVFDRVNREHWFEVAKQRVFFSRDETYLRVALLRVFTEETDEDRVYTSNVEHEAYAIAVYGPDRETRIYAESSELPLEISLYALVEDDNVPVVYGHLVGTPDSPFYGRFRLLLPDGIPELAFEYFEQTR